MSTATPTLVGHHGDVVFLRLIEQPKTALTPQTVINKRSVLQAGLATGHTHSIDASLGSVFTGSDNERYLHVSAEDGATVEHEEHADTHLDAGWYLIRIAREWTGEAIRSVMD